MPAPESDAPSLDAAETIDCDGRWITPGLVDCHTHIVYGGNRAHEFELRLAGASYDEISRAGGGIVSTMRATREASEDELLAQRAEACRGADARRRHDAGNQVRLRPRPRQRDEVPARCPSSRAKCCRCPSSRPSSARMRCRPRPTATRTLTSRRSATTIAGGGEGGLADAVDAFCELSPSRPSRRRASSRPRARSACRSSCTPNSSRPWAAPRWPRASAPCRPIISNMPTRPASRRSRKAGTVAVLLPGAFYFLRETQKPPVDLLRKHGVPIAISSDSNPGTSPLTSLLLTMNMAATFFRLTVDECLAGRDAPGGTRAGPARSGRHPRSRQIAAISRSGTSSGRPSWSIASASRRCISGSGEASDSPAR